MKTKDAIEKLKKAIASPATPENFKESLRKKLAELEGVKDPADKVEKVVKRAAKKTKKLGRPEGVTSVNKKEPKVTAKRDGEEKEPDCAELLSRFNERRAAAKQSARKAKTTPVFRKIATDVVDAVEKAINNVPAEDIKNTKKGQISYIKRFKFLQVAAENFLKAFKDVLGTDYKSKESEKEIQELEDLITKLQQKYSNK